MKIGNLQKSVQKPNTRSNKNHPSVRIESHKIKMQNALIYKTHKDPFDTQDEPSVDSITFENVDINKSDLNNLREDKIRLLSPDSFMSVSISMS